MCGILGCINFKHSPESLDSINHRGPDGSGVKNFTINGHAVTLAHRRLSIVDVSENGAQPMASGDGNAFITFNGEIYNHETLKPKMSFTGFKGHSDTETLVNYFNEKAISQYLKDLNGIFGFAILDQKNQRLHIARDRFGVKPIYYYFKNNQLVFSSEIRPFKYYIPMEYDRENVIEGLKMRYVGAPDTIFHDVKKMEAGQLLTFDLSQQEIALTKEYYVQTPKMGSRKQEASSLVKEYGDLFEQAVERQLMSDVEIGVLLSGGIDSALVAAVAKNKSARPLKTFTVGFKEGLFESDEIEMAKVTAQTLKLENIHVRTDFSDFIEDLKKIIRIVEEPIATNSIIPMYSLSKLTSEHVKVVLSGQGADEPLYGYRKYKGLIFLKHLERNGFLRNGLKLTGLKNFKKEDVRRFYDAAVEKDMLIAYREYNSISSGNELSSLLNKSGLTDTQTILRRKEGLFKEKWNKRIPSDRSIISFPFLDLRNSLADDLLMYTDKLMMHFSVECRVPILDNDLIDFIESLHHSYKLSFSKGKIIHKQFAEEYLPSSIVHRKKIGFATPASKWYKTHKQVIEDMICSSKEVQKIFNIGAIRDILNTHEQNENGEKQILLLLSLALLMEE
ncbi:MAG: asparagine synthase (glutamine-hydrolyzing) [Chitinophagaceae bacterium]|nr:asparagine synthase (glutamine-hydrolyzing) [Chitinophagaceae bacterium]